MKKTILAFLILSSVNAWAGGSEFSSYVRENNCVTNMSDEYGLARYLATQVCEERPAIRECLAKGLAEHRNLSINQVRSVCDAVYRGFGY
jgi:hypothetical protein